MVRRVPAVRILHVGALGHGHHWRSVDGSSRNRRRDVAHRPAVRAHRRPARNLGSDGGSHHARQQPHRGPGDVRLRNRLRIGGAASDQSLEASRAGSGLVFLRSWPAQPVRSLRCCSPSAPPLSSRGADSSTRQPCWCPSFLPSFCRCCSRIRDTRSSRPMTLCARSRSASSLRLSSPLSRSGLVRSSAPPWYLSCSWSRHLSVSARLG